MQPGFVSFVGLLFLNGSFAVLSSLLPFLVFPRSVVFKTEAYNSSAVYHIILQWFILPCLCAPKPEQLWGHLFQNYLFKLPSVFDPKVRDKVFVLAELLLFAKYTQTF